MFGCDNEGKYRHLQAAIGEFGRLLRVMHNVFVVLYPRFGEKEGSRGRQSWAERWEGDCEARLGVLQEAPSKAEES